MLRFFFPLLLGCMVGCYPNYTIIEHSDLTLPAGGEKPQIVVEMVNGPVTITTAQCKDITGQLTKRGVGEDKEHAEKELEVIVFEHKIVDDKIVIKAKRADGSRSWNSSGTEAKLQVPVGSSIELITSNGSIHVTGKNQGVMAKSSNGSITLKDVKNSVDVHTSNGAVRCDGVVGQAHVETSNGSIVLNGQKMIIDCKSNNGTITCTGELAEGSHKAVTSNGMITFALPADTSMTIEAATSNGKIRNEFSASKNESSNKKKDNYFKGTIGSGSPSRSLYIKTSNSSISLKKEKPAKDTTVVTE